MNCSTLYELVGAKDHNRILSLELLNRNNAVRLLVVAPLGVDLRNGIDISGSGFETFKMIVETCQTGGCLSTRQMPSKTLEQWKISKTLILEFKDSSGALIRSEVSLTGFGAAFSLAEKS